MLTYLVKYITLMITENCRNKLAGVELESPGAGGAETKPNQRMQLLQAGHILLDKALK